MSKLRSINTKFWNDNYVIDLDPIEKLLFLYLLTNEQTNMLGIYELHIRRISFDTGIDKDMVSKIFTRFEQKGKVKYIDGYVVLQNFLKHQSFNSNMQKSAINTWNELPNRIKTDEFCKPITKGLEAFGTHAKGLDKGEKMGAKNTENSDLCAEKGEPLPKGSEPIAKVEVERERELERERETETQKRAREENQSTDSIPKIPKKEPQKNSAKKVPLSKDDLNEQITEAGEEILRVFKKVFPGFQSSAKDYDSRMRVAYQLRDYLAETTGKDPTLYEMTALLTRMLNNPPDYWESQPTPKSVYNNFNHFTSALQPKKSKKNGKLSIKEAYRRRNERRGINTG